MFHGLGLPGNRTGDCTGHQDSSSVPAHGGGGTVLRNPWETDPGMEQRSRAFWGSVGWSGRSPEGCAAWLGVTTPPS